MQNVPRPFLVASGPASCASKQEHADGYMHRSMICHLGIRYNNKDCRQSVVLMHMKQDVHAAAVNVWLVMAWDADWEVGLDLSLSTV